MTCLLSGNCADSALRFREGVLPATDRDEDAAAFPFSPKGSCSLPSRLEATKNVSDMMDASLASAAETGFTCSLEQATRPDESLLLACY
jgi:hypothetical protein